MSKDYSKYCMGYHNQNVDEQGTISIVYLSCLYTTQWNVQDIVSFTRSRVRDESHDRIGTQNNPLTKRQTDRRRITGREVG